jgi:hypothetical protein
MIIWFTFSERRNPPLEAPPLIRGILFVLACALQGINALQAVTSVTPC